MIVPPKRIVIGAIVVVAITGILLAGLRFSRLFTDSPDSRVKIGGVQWRYEKSEAASYARRKY